jgi:hypothetical protein
MANLKEQSNQHEKEQEEARPIRLVPVEWVSPRGWNMLWGQGQSTTFASSEWAPTDLLLLR